MSSTDLEAPPLRLTFAAIIVVVGLHILTAIALVAIKTPELKIEAKKDASPIEIELISLPTETPPPEVEVIEVAPKQEPAPQVAEQQPETAKSIVPPKPEAPEKPVVREEKTTPKPAPIVPVKEQKVVEKPKEPPKETVVKPKVDTSVADEQRKIIAAKAERAAQAEQAQAARDAQAKADREAQANRDAQAKADREAQANRDAQAQAARVAEEAKAARESAARAQAAASAKAAAEKAAAASNTPVNFSGSDASWIREPKFENISSEQLTLAIKFSVDKQGNIKNIQVNGTKDQKLKQEVKRRLQRSKIKPFIQNGAPVVGAVAFSIVVQ
ncbi:energy transducer TonB [Psychrobacter vallis]|uniref:energy transducer TonB n=1 Tax=Psychrobacter vallis TaxID=248451 RepID=UPI00191ABC29|nr:energy transducer TonB [Psychrobacter vallis]